MKKNTSFDLKNIDLDLSAELFTLANGLTVVIHSKPAASVVAVNMTYKVGSKDEPKNKTGIAHLCEHLMFGGTEALPGSYLENMLNNGAIDVNGVTSRDRTNYYQTVLPGMLDYVLFAESDRMSYFGQHLTSDLLERQRSVVLNEKDERDGEPLGRLSERRNLATFPAFHPYSHTVIGEKSHLESITLDELKAWFNTYYVPSNAILTLAGDVDSQQIRDKISTYFGSIASGKPLLRPAIDYPLISIGKRETLEARVAQSALHLTWNLPPASEKCTTEFLVLSSLLTMGNDAYLHKKLVIEAELASQVSAYVEQGLLCSQFTITAVARTGVTLTQLEKGLLDAIEELKNQNIDSDALEKTRARSLTDFIWGAENMTGIADMFGWFTFMNGSPNTYKNFFDVLFGVTDKSLLAIAHDWLNENRFTMYVVPFSPGSTNALRSAAPAVPAILPPAKIKVPSGRTSILSNGMKLSHIQYSSVPGTLIRIIIPHGTAGNPANKEGLTALTCRVLVSEAEDGNLIKSLGKIGASFTIENGFDSTIITLKTLSICFDQALGYLSEQLLSAPLSEKEFKRIQGKSLQNIASQLSSHSGLIQFLLPEFVYPVGHPYRRYNHGQGTPESLSGITYEDVVAERNLLIQRAGIKIVAVTDLTIEAIQHSIEESLSHWISPHQNKQDYSSLNVPESLNGRALLIHKPGSIQTTVVAANLIPPFEEGTHASYTMLARIFSSSFNSQLNLRLREELNWTYGVQGSTTSDSGIRMHVIKTTVQKDKTLETIKEIQHAYDQLLAAGPIAEEELKTRLVSEQLRLIANGSDSLQLLNNLTHIEKNHLPVDYWSDYYDSLSILKPENLHEVAEQFFKPHKIHWIIVGDIHNIESALKLHLPAETTLVNADEIIKGE